MIHRIKLRLSNAYLVRGERPILVDTGSPGEGARIVAELDAQGVRPADLALILHTHVHSDHVGGTAELARLGVTAQVAMHPADAPLREQGHNGPLRGIGLRGRIMARFFRNAPFLPFTPDLFVSDGLRLDEFGVSGRILHTPGHTAGSVSLVLDNGEAIVGDVVMGGYLGGAVWASRPNYHYFADDVGQVVRSLDRLLSLSPRVLHVGHGGPLMGESVRSRFAHELRPLSPTAPPEDAEPGAAADGGA